MIFTPHALRRRPDQTTFSMNELAKLVGDMQSTIRVTSRDKGHVIIIGEQPLNPATKKPYEFGIKKYAVKGDRLELKGDISWT